MSTTTKYGGQQHLDWADDDHSYIRATPLEGQLETDVSEVLASIRESLGDDDEPQLTIASLDEELDEYEQPTGVFMHVDVDEEDELTDVFYRSTVPSLDDVGTQPHDTARYASPDDTPTHSSELGGADAPAGPRDRASLTVLTGHGAGAVIHVGSEELAVGRSRDADLHFHDASISLRHARFFRFNQGVYFEDLGSDNGSRVRGIAANDCVRLQDGDHVILGDERVLRFNLYDAAEEEAAIELYESSVRDVTTGAFNRGHLDGRLGVEKALARQQGHPLWLMLIDIDDFEWVNSIHGHLVGDMVLRVLAATVQRNLRPADTLGRYGGDEFVVICPDVALCAVESLAERIRADVERLPLCAGGNDFHVTVSIGIAGGRSEPAYLGALVDAADRAMYRAKRAGRNAVAAE